MLSKLKTILSIAGSDPTGGAGIQADIRTGVSKGTHVMTAITGVTVQNSKGLSEIGLVNPNILDAQLNAIIEEVTPDAIKIGMIGSRENLEVISDFLKTIPKNVPVVVDPVMKATADGNQLMKDGEKIITPLNYRESILPFSWVITPNIEELKILLENNIFNSQDPLSITNNLNTNAVIIKGGHSEESDIQDILITRRAIYKNSHRRIECKNLHGTGCVYSTLMAIYLAKGETLEDAFNKTSSDLFQIINNSCDYNLGNSSYGPLNINNYCI